MEKELKIEIPQGYEIDRQKSTFEKIIFKKIPENPKTWEDYCKLTRNKFSFYAKPSNTINTDYYYCGSFNEFSTKERAEQFIALGKLLQLRDYWVKGYYKFSYLVWNSGGRRVFVCGCDGVTPYPLTFPTKGMAEEFKDCFEDLIKQAFPLV